MDENYYDNGNDTDDQEEIRFETTKNQKLSSVFVCQFVVCLMLLAIFGGLKFLSPQTFNQVKEDVTVSLEGEEFKKGIQSVCQNIIDSINNITPLNASSSATSEDSQQNEQQPSQQNEQQEEINGTALESTANTVQQANIKPYILPVIGQVTSPFGERIGPINNDQSEIHEGVDIGAQEGTEIKAISKGYIETIASSNRSGNYLIINHENGITSLYAHCSEILVHEGDTIQQGQIIAKVGQTGEATGPHLHLGIKENGTYINPTQILPELQ